MRVVRNVLRRCCLVLKVSIALGVALLLTASNGATQQSAPTLPRPATTAHPVPRRTTVEDKGPQSTTATYGDWILQCQMQSETSAAKLCDIAQVAQVQGNNNPFSRVAVARPAKGQPFRLMVQVPINVSLNKSVRIQTDSSDPGVAAPFARCVPTGCFADFELNDETLKKLRSASGAGKVSFADASGRDIAVPLSFKGFSQAFDALAKE